MIFVVTLCVTIFADCISPIYHVLFVICNYLFPLLVLLCVKIDRNIKKGYNITLKA